MFGVFEKKSANHVCECDGNGFALYPHTLSISCKCKPEIGEIFDSGMSVIIHKENFRIEKEYHYGA